MDKKSKIKSLHIKEFRNISTDKNLYRHELFLYNENGKLIEHTSYPDIQERIDGTGVDFKETYLYDNEDKLIESIVTRLDGSFISRTNYKYDENKNIIEKGTIYNSWDEKEIISRDNISNSEEIILVNRDGLIKHKTIVVYDNKNRVIETKEYSLNDGKYYPWFRECNVYDENDSLIVEAGYDVSNQKCSYRNTYKYDEDGSLFEYDEYLEQIFDDGGPDYPPYESKYSFSYISHYKVKSENDEYENWVKRDFIHIDWGKETIERTELREIEYYK
ncbi:MAG: hypothetical protein KDC47_05140 [Flavobacteriaceae bacterium]|nr:hypothetical protein [Flavobacteriaceae bacterium]